MIPILVGKINQTLYRGLPTSKLISFAEVDQTFFLQVYILGTRKFKIIFGVQFLMLCTDFLLFIECDPDTKR